MWEFEPPSSDQLNMTTQIHMTNYNDDPDQVLEKIDEITKGFKRCDSITYRYLHFSEGIHRVTFKNLRLIKNIKTKNDALLNSQHDDKLVRYHCKKILQA